MKSGNKIVLGCIIFNLLLEYWVHGFLFFLNPLSSIPLVILYLTYFSMLEDLILRFKLKDYQILSFSFAFWVFYDIFIDGSIFLEAYFLGINPFNLIIIDIFWWGLIQTILTMYFANRFFERRDWNEETMGKLGWVLSFSWYFLLFWAGTLFNDNKRGTLTGYITGIVIFLIGIILFILCLKKGTQIVSENNYSFNQSKLLDIISIIWIILCLIIGTLFSGALIVQIGAHLWTLFMGIIIIIYRIRKRMSISV